MIFRYKKYHFLLSFVVLSFVSYAQRIDKLYYEDGSIKAEGILENGIKSGHWHFYYPSGELSSIENYRENQLDGTIKYFDDQANLIAIEFWNLGVQQDSSIYFYPNGKVEKRGVFEDGLYEGKWKFFYNNGNLKRTGSYSDGLPVGKWTFYNEKGILIQEGHFEHGLEEGEWKFYGDFGDLEYFGNFHKGEKTGDWFRVTKKGKQKTYKY